MRRLLSPLILIVILFSVFGLRLKSLFSRSYSVGTKIRITERLSEQPYHSGSTQTFRLAGFKVVAPPFPPYNYGDMLVVEGELREEASNSSFEVLNKNKSNFWLLYPKIVELNARGFEAQPLETVKISIGKWLVTLRSKFVQLYGKYLPEPHASLLSGIVLGFRAKMPESFYTDLRETGTLHVIAASGMNVTIVAGLMMAMLVKVITRRKAIVVTILGVVFYVFLAGASPPVVRAGIMGVIAYVAAYLGREKDGVIALVVTGLVMLLINPLYILDVGWQLSFAATGGIIWLYPVVERYILKGFDKLPLALGSELGVTVAAQLATIPIIVYHFGTFSWISPVVNMLVAPVVPVLMVWGGIILVLGFLWSGLGQLASWGVWVFLEYFVGVVEWFGERFEALRLDRVSLWWVAGYYLILMGLVWRLHLTASEDE